MICEFRNYRIFWREIKTSFAKEARMHVHDRLWVLRTCPSNILDALLGMVSLFTAIEREACLSALRLPNIDKHKPANRKGRPLYCLNTKLLQGPKGLDGMAVSLSLTKIILWWFKVGKWRSQSWCMRPEISKGQTAYGTYFLNISSRNLCNPCMCIRMSKQAMQEKANLHSLWQSSCSKGPERAHSNLWVCVWVASRSERDREAQWNAPIWADCARQRQSKRQHIRYRTCDIRVITGFYAGRNNL